MCMSTPSAPAAPPPPQYLHNPFLDGSTMQGNGYNRGRNSLRTDLGTAGDGAMPVPKMKGAATAGPPQSTGPSAPSGGLTLPAGTLPTMGQPGMVVPTVGGAMAGLLAGQVTSGTGLSARTAVSPRAAVMAR